MEKKKEKIITFIIIFIISCLLYSIFLMGYCSIDTQTVVGKGYTNYAINYSFYDGRIIMGCICLIMDFFHAPYKVFYVIVLVMAIAISTITVVKLIEIVSKQERISNKLTKILIYVLCYLCVFNFMTIDNMQFIENFVMSLSVLFYLISAEKIILKSETKKGIIYCVIGTFCYQGTINMFIALSFLFIFLKYENINKRMLKDIFLTLVTLFVASAINIVVKKIIEILIISSQKERLSLNILNNISDNIKKFKLLIYDTLELFPSGVYMLYIALTLSITYLVYAKKKIKSYFIVFFLFLIAIISSVLLICIYPTGIFAKDGRIFGSIGASFSILWIYLLIKTDIIENKVCKYVVTICIMSYLILNMYNIFVTTLDSYKEQLLDENISKQIEKEVVRYEQETNNKIKYFAIRYKPITDDDIKNNTVKIIKRDNALRLAFCQSALYCNEMLKVHTNLDKSIEQIYFEEDIQKQYFPNYEKEIMCIDDTVYIIL